MDPSRREGGSMEGEGKKKSPYRLDRSITYAFHIDYYKTHNNVYTHILNINRCGVGDIQSTL